MSSAGKARIQVALGAFAISLAAPIVKLVAVPPTVSAFYRMLFGALALGFLLLIKRRWRAGWQRGWGASAAIALFFALDLWFWHRSIHWLGPGLATLLANFQVFILPLSAGLLSGELVDRRFFIGLGFAAAGLWLLFGVHWASFSAQNRIGIVFGLLTALAYAAYLMSLKYAERRPAAPATVARLFQITLLSALMIAVAIVFEKQGFQVASETDWLLLVAYGILCQVLGWLLITRGLPIVPVAIAGLLLLLQPSLSIVWDGMFFDLALSPWQGFGVALALSGIYFGSVRHKAQ